MDVLRSAAMAFSSFSRIPVPQVEWTESSMRYMMCFFPVIGVAIGVVLGLWCALCQWLGFAPVLFGAGVALVPLLVTGGIHLDGFCDVVDAQSSHAAPERKREILKDPHAGAFASIAIAAYVVAYAGFASELECTWHTVALLCGAHVMSRCMSSIATITYPTSASKGMLSMFHESAHSKRVMVVVIIEFAVCLAALLVCDTLAALCMAVVGLVCLGALLPFSRTQFGGMSGDLAGFFLQVAELAMLIALVVVTKAVVL